jgi:hypothetical protein
VAQGSDGEFPRAFDAAIRRRNVSLAWLQGRLAERGSPVSVTALSYWRSGRSQPERATSLDALDELERILGLGQGSLRELLGPSRRPGPAPLEAGPEELFESRPGVVAALRALGFRGMSDELIEQLSHISVDVDADGRIRSDVSRTLVRARRDGARRLPLVVARDDVGRLPRFVPLVGCTLGRQQLDPDEGVYAAELILERELRRGETCMFELRVDSPEPIDDTSYEHFASHRLDELLMWVRFHPDRLPARVELCRHDGSGETSEPLELGGGTTAHVLARRFGPGLLGLRWGW